MNSKKIISLALAGMLTFSALTLSSCSSKENGSDSETTDTDTSSALTVTPIPDGVDINYVMDYMNEDLDAYVALGEYKGLSVEVESYDVTDEYVDTKVGELLESMAETEKVTDRKTAEGDTVNVDYVGTLDGEAFKGGTASGAELKLASDSGYIPGFAEGMYDVMPGESFSYNVTFPEDYKHSTELAGKEVTFTVTVNYILGDKIVPELNDDFVKANFGSEGCNTVDEFMTYYKGYLEKQRDDSVKSSAESKVWEQIMNNATVISLPEKAVDAMYWATRTQYEQSAVGYGMTYEQFMQTYVGGTDEDFRTYCEDYIKEDVVIYQIVKAEGLAVTDEEYAEGVKNFASDYSVTEEELVERYTETRIKSVMQWNKLMDAVYSWSNVTIKTEG